MVCGGMDRSDRLVNHGQVKHVAGLFMAEGQGDDRCLNICVYFGGHGKPGACFWGEKNVVKNLPIA